MKYRDGIFASIALALTSVALAGVGVLLIGVFVAFVAMIGFTLWVGIAEGQPGENRYGQPPLTPAMV